MHSIDTLTDRVVSMLDMDPDAARDALSGYLRQREAVERRALDPSNLDDADAAFLVESVRQAHKAGDMGMRELAHVQEAVFRIEAAEDHLRAVMTERDEAVRAALAAGAKATEVAEVAGISRAWLYRIRDAGKKA